MTFSTLTFLLAFLPLLLGLYFALPKGWIAAKNGVLLVSSLLFYAWGEPVYLFLILLCALWTYALCFGVAKKKKWALFLAVAGNLLPLLVFKYGNFLLENADALTGLSLGRFPFSLPVGISFYTFQVLTYVIDLYRGRVKLQKNPAYLTLYVFLFPQLIAGPIVRYSDIARELTRRRVTAGDLGEGVWRLARGLFMKVMLANPAGFLSTTLLSQSAAGAGTRWLAVVAYGVQIFFDFSGYSDMAIGLGHMFGFRFPENFDAPYRAVSVTDFWRRWHMTLSSFFRDYVYIPLGGSRRGLPRQLVNLFVVWFLTGLWHGASWNFALWGLYFFVLLVLEKVFLLRLLSKWPPFLARLWTLGLVMLGWSIFMTETNSLSQLAGAIGGLFSAGPWVSLRSLGLQDELALTAVGLLLSVCRLPGGWREWLERRGSGAVALRGVVAVALLLVCVAALLGQTFNPFIYFRF